MKNSKFYDYYIFVDYSEGFVGYSIINQNKIFELLLKISRFKHYREQRNKSVYLGHIKSTMKKERLYSFFERLKILKANSNLDLFLEIFDFLKKVDNSFVFLCIDDYQFKKFKKLFCLVNCERVDIKKESELKKGTPEYKVSLVIDNLLNIERRKSIK